VVVVGAFVGGGVVGLGAGVVVTFGAAVVAGACFTWPAVEAVVDFGVAGAVLADVAGGAVSD
jgi:hypothetical protein